MSMKNLLIVISGPSGVGKGTIVDRLMQSGNYALSISCTTRPPRTGEKDGVSYFFLTEKKFESMIAENGFLEYSRHFENYYGTPREFVEKQLKSNNVILEIDVDGALSVKRKMPDALLIMIAPPDIEELRARLKERGTESDRKIEERIERADYELSQKVSYDYTVINDDLDRAVAEVERIIKAEQNRQ